MSKRLMLMRHAKSDWSNEALADKERPLNARGKQAAPRMAQWLSEQHWLPDLILCSAATRTQETLQRMQTVWENADEPSGHQHAPMVRIVDQLYLASPATILSCAQSACSGRAVASVLVIGHNPGMELLASELSCGELSMPTAAIVVLTHPKESWPEDWADPISWKLERMMVPNELDAELD